jgi:HD-like signal output (HDOD) protein
VAECITDQILVTKILRICNSPFYRSMGKVSSLREAVVRIGFKSLLSIVTVHALSSFSPRNVDEIRKVLQHCLVCAMIARQMPEIWVPTTSWLSCADCCTISAKR